MTCKNDQQYTWSLIAGDDSERVFVYKNSDGTLIDLTGCTASLSIDVGAVADTSTCAIDGPNGSITAIIPNTVSELFTGNGEFKLRLIDTNAKVKTLVYGTLQVTT